MRVVILLLPRWRPRTSGGADWPKTTPPMTGITSPMAFRACRGAPYSSRMNTAVIFCCCILCCIDCSFSVGEGGRLSSSSSSCSSSFAFSAKGWMGGVQAKAYDLDDAWCFGFVVGVWVACRRGCVRVNAPSADYIRYRYAPSIPASSYGHVWLAICCLTPSMCYLVQ